MAATSCTIPVPVLMAAPFSLPWGSNIYAKVVAYNLYGDSVISEYGNEAIILRLPDAPLNLQETVEARTEQSIRFTWQAGLEDGGTPVLDYRVSYDQATDTWEVLETGVTEHFYLKQQLTAGLTYKFKVEARTAFGYSDYS